MVGGKKKGKGRRNPGIEFRGETVPPESLRHQKKKGDALPSHLESRRGLRIPIRMKAQRKGGKKNGWTGPKFSGPKGGKKEEDTRSCRPWAPQRGNRERAREADYELYRGKKKKGRGNKGGAEMSNSKITFSPQQHQIKRGGSRS